MQTNLMDGSVIETEVGSKEKYMQINLMDGSAIEIGVGAKGFDLVRQVKKSLNGHQAVALKVNDIFKDLNTELQDGDTIQVLTFDDPEGKEIFWHSSAHLLAQAIARLYPEAKPTIGPAIESGFYYDFADLSISADDFPQIEAEVQKIIQERFEPKRIEYSDKEEAKRVFNHNPFKIEMIEKLDEGLSAYSQGEFIDLCRGPHIPHLGIVQAFKLMKTSGAYWRGDKNNPQLTRIYGISFPDKKLLKSHLNFLEEAAKRDHRIIGKQLGLFSFHKEGPGMPFIHPKGMIVWNELMRYWQEQHDREGYKQIKTPILMSHELWETSGHWDFYRENMYLSVVDEKTSVLKPMNCPGGMLFYKEDMYSYRQLPLRIAEVGVVHRHEFSGALSGLFRVRCFHQDDAHIFMKPTDIADEIHKVLSLATSMYKLFGLDYHLELSTRPEQSIGTDEQWQLATDGLIESLNRCGYTYRLNEGDGAFYGPKIDIHIRDAIGRTWQCGTIQLDLNLPERFDLNYIDANGEKQRPVMIHRVIYGSIERFFGILIEHYAGKFPLWLAPIQVTILPVAESHHNYAESVLEQFLEAGLRAEVDFDNESINKKVRKAQLKQINYIIVVGDKELTEGTLSVRAANNLVGTKPIAEVINSLKDEYQSRSPRRNTV
ncbi:threonyl-tRNA synthetase [Legionella busanensis]|uniref:Threonine--tRNA ligase n=1 Tax=Legionella busanensis TaxID=190655 RepID=A0A378JHI8_9GAMM|nr:threonine--tRNA ligase [Legionella busanensis]STX50477.1 threonyl-tRNA synthetase [Legionella busanensis]